MEEIFTAIYENQVWGDNQNKNYRGSSGGGSEVAYNEKYIGMLKEIIKKCNIRSVVDLGCGDFRIGHLLYDDLDIMYTGYDVYKKIIEYNSICYTQPKFNFKCLDFCKNIDQVTSGDLCILKDVLQHWELKKIYAFMDLITQSQKFKYILIVNCCNQMEDDTNCATGEWRPLSCKYMPLKKYNAKMIGRYNSKEVSIIYTNQ